MCEGGGVSPPTVTFLLFQSMRGGGAWALLALSYASDSGAAKICQQGAKARERSDRAGGGELWEGVHSREIFENSGMKTTLSCTLNAIIRGKIIVKYSIHESPTPPLWISFIPINGGGGGGGGCAWGRVPLSYASNSGAARICHENGILLHIKSHY